MLVNFENPQKNMCATHQLLPVSVAHKDPNNHNKADLRDMSTTAEMRAIFQLCFYGMCASPNLFSFKIRSFYHGNTSIFAKIQL